MLFIPTKVGKQAARRLCFFVKQSCSNAAVALCHEGLADAFSCFVQVLGTPRGITSFKCPMVTGGESV